MIEFKPCPFCGCEKIEIKVVGTKGSDSRYAAMCDDCGARGGRKANKDSAIASWNERM
ncbi:Lar family restriction alleviation protein [Lachnoclostridium phytofermentans]|uniref:Lar family restriction alleviation protein n=1 Tax=Lachnoclostridium phytofermentans TaxID=66219 RepID=UPI0002EA6C29|nr:Lar family restriction alleviation protein [Lachnoclostridium phytofermentans]